MSVLCTGSIAFDTLMTYPGYFKDHIIPEHLDKISLSFLVDTMVKQYGGTAPNIAFTLALLGQKPFLVGTVGIDFVGYREWLEDKGVDTSYARVISDEYTASFFANTDLSNAQICSFYTGAMRHAAEISLREFQLKSDDLVIISPNDPHAMDLYVQECQELGLSYLYDPGQQVARSSADELHRGVLGANSLFVNEYEYQLLQKHTGLQEKEILQQVDYLVVTLGEKGACIYVKDQRINVGVVPPNRIADPTGVGDAFRGGFVSGYLLGYDWLTCGQMGALAATYCLEQKGCQNHMFTPEEFVARYRLHFDDQGLLNSLL
jgi:adenosine kinase